MSAEPRLLDVRKNVLKKNDVIARALRERFQDAGVFVFSLVSSPGSGKAEPLEKTLAGLRARCGVATLAGDLATDFGSMKGVKSQP